MTLTDSNLTFFLAFDLITKLCAYNQLHGAQLTTLHSNSWLELQQCFRAHVSRLAWQQLNMHGIIFLTILIDWLFISFTHTHPHTHIHSLVSLFFIRLVLKWAEKKKKTSPLYNSKCVYAWTFYLCNCIKKCYYFRLILYWANFVSFFLLCFFSCLMVNVWFWFITVLLLCRMAESCWSVDQSIWWGRWRHRIELVNWSPH